MSQSLTQSQDPNRISISIEKYSHSTSRRGAQNLGYVHIGDGTHLDLLIRNIRTSNQGNFTTKLVLQVSTTSQIIYTLDVDELAAYYRKIKTRPQEGDAPVHVTFRRPSWLAIGYPEPGGKIERRQFKFYNELELNRVLEWFTDLGFDLTEMPSPAMGGPQLRPVTTPALSIYSATSVGTSHSMASSVSRPTSASAESLRSATSPSESLPKPQSSLAMYNLPDPPSGVLGNTDTRGERGAGLQPFNTPYQLTSAHSFSAPRTESGFGGTRALGSTSFYVSQMQRAAENQISPLPSTTTSQSEVANLWPVFSTPILDIHSDFTRPASTGQDHSTHPIRSPFFPHPSDGQDSHQILTSNIMTASQNRFDEGFSVPTKAERPSSAPQSTQISPGFYLPPKRELPFAKSSANSRLRASSNADLTPLPKPTPVGSVGSTADHSKVQRKKETFPPKKETRVPPPVPKVHSKRIVPHRDFALQTSEPRNTSTADGLHIKVDPLGTISEEEASSLGTNSRLSTSSCANSTLEFKSNPPKRKASPIRPSSALKRPKMVDQSTQTQLSNKLVSYEAASCSDSQNRADHQRQDHSLKPLPLDYLQHIEKVVGDARIPAHQVEIYETDEYLNASPEERDILLNNFICKNLQNPAFRQLCKDMENAWRRIGFM